MDLQKIKALIDLLADSPLRKIEVIEGEERVKLVKAKRRGKRSAAGAGMPPAVAGQGSDRPRSEAAHAADPVEAAIVPQQGVAQSTPVLLPKLVCAPMFGIVHLTPSPDAAPFVQVGDTVEEGQVLCAIEAMKMFNAIESDCHGTMREVLVAPGSEVESGQPLFRIG